MKANPLFDHEWYVAWNNRVDLWQAIDCVTLNRSVSYHAKVGGDQLFHDPRPIRGNRRNAEGAAKRLNNERPRGPHVPPPTQGSLFAGSNSSNPRRFYWWFFAVPRDAAPRIGKGVHGPNSSLAQYPWKYGYEEFKVFESKDSAESYYRARTPIRLPDKRPLRSNPGRIPGAPVICGYHATVDKLRVRVIRRDPDGGILSEGPDTWAHRVGFLQPGVKWSDLSAQNKRDLLISWKRHGGGSGKYANPPRIPGAPVIYGRTESIRMTKTSGPYKGQKFVHKFGPGVRQHGFPPGTRVLIPAGKKGFRAVELTKRTVLLERPHHNLWNRFK